VVLDTNAISDLLAGNPRLERLLSGDTRHHLPTIVLGEYRYGILASARRDELEQLLNRLEADSFILYPDRETARHYADIRWRLKQSGQPIPENDIWIAWLGSTSSRSPAATATSTVYPRCAARGGRGGDSQVPAPVGSSNRGVLGP
jgi:tRNA(fMet)-specific endonuclease VapC